MAREVVHGDDDDASDNVAVGEADRVDNTLVDIVATGRASRHDSVVSRTRTVDCSFPSYPLLDGDPLSLCSKPSY